MRNFLAVLLIGLVLGGCNSEERRFDGSFVDNGSANNSQPRGSNDDGGQSGGSQAGNQAPTIAGNPPQAVLYNEIYNFAPYASDPDGDALAFSIQNPPPWANFDPLTGRLSGQPSIADIGTYENIEISVSDGKTSRSLPLFSIAVSQDALGSVTLSWTPPFENEDGSALTDLAGYEIHYGRESGNYDQSIRIDNPSITTYVVDQLVPGTYYFAATAFNYSGVESDFSAEAVRILN